MPCLALPCLLALACDGTFCEEFPAACDVVGGQGAGGAPPAQLVDVAVSLLDLYGDVVPDAVILVSGPDGEALDQSVTPALGAHTVSAPVGGYVSVFHVLGDRNFAFTAGVVESAPAFTFRMPVPNAEVTTIDVTVTLDCTSGCNAVELSGSCFDPIKGDAPNQPLTFAILDYVDCSRAEQIDLFAVGYSGTGIAESRSTKKPASLGPMIELLAPTSLRISDTLNLTMTIEGDIGANEVSRGVRVPYLDGRGFGFSRFRPGSAQSISISVVKEFAPHAEAQFFVTLPQGRLFRQEWFDSVDSSTTSTFVLSALAIPSVPSAPEESGASQPTASYALEEGPLGDAVQLRVLDSNVEWTVTLPPAATGSFRFPDPPNDLTVFKLAGIDAYEVMSVDRDTADSYAAFVSEPIYSHAREHGLDSVTVATSTLR